MGATLAGLAFVLPSFLMVVALGMAYVNYGGLSWSCDDCVPRGCDCNHRYIDVNAYHPALEDPDLPEGEEGKDWKWLDDEKTHWCHIDEKGREYPCAEYWYEEEGWETEEE
jgi:hypothetical protein